MSSCTVMMSTYNGEKYVKECIQSILSQKNIDVSLFIRDDGSTDSTCSVLKKFEEDKRVSILYGKNLNYTSSFLTLLFQAPKSDYYAFADQDDIWLPEKLYSAIQVLQKAQNLDKPLLYCSRTTYVDGDLKPIVFREPDYYYNTLEGVMVKQQWPGCTMVFNESLFQRSLLLKPVLEQKSQSGHDAWVNLVCMTVGGEMVIDEKSYILFRRHGGNVSIGTSFLNKYPQLIRMKLFEKRYRRRDTARFLLSTYSEMIPPHNRDFLMLCATYDQKISSTLKLLFYPTLKCNTLKCRLGIWLMILIHRF